MKILFFRLRGNLLRFRKNKFWRLFRRGSPPPSLDSRDTRLKIDFSRRAKNEAPFYRGEAFIIF